MAQLPMLSKNAKLARAFGAQAVDMEAAAVAKGAETHGVRFMACKAISDDKRFLHAGDGGISWTRKEVSNGRFALHVALRPRLWDGHERTGSRRRAGVQKIV